jgi:hypothetical protein
MGTRSVADEATDDAVRHRAGGDDVCARQGLRRHVGAGRREVEYHAGPGTMTIVLGANEFKVTMGDGTRAATVAFKLDGTETELEHGNKGKAEWKGDKLEATIISSRGPSSVTFSREARHRGPRCRARPQPVQCDSAGGRRAQEYVRAAEVSLRRRSLIPTEDAGRRRAAGRHRPALPAIMIPCAS